MITQSQQSNQILVKLSSTDENWEPCTHGILTLYPKFIDNIKKAVNLIKTTDIPYPYITFLDGSLFCIDTDADQFWNREEDIYLTDKLREFSTPCRVDTDLNMLPDFRTNGIWCVVHNENCIRLYVHAKHTNVKFETEELTLPFLENS